MQLPLVTSQIDAPRTTKGIAGIIKEIDIFQTEGIRYMGSKRTLIPFIHEALRGLPINTVLDGFSGSTRVSQFFKKAGYSVHANDVAAYSSIFGTAYLINNDTNPDDIATKIKYLNAIAPVDGFFTEAYGGTDDGAGNVVAIDGKKKPFQVKNTRKVDAIRPEIDRIAANETERCILLTSLILALDKVENTLGHQVSYLSKWGPRSYEDIVLTLPKLISGSRTYQTTQLDVSSIRGQYDLAYFDPPYNTNNTVTASTRVRYASYYHLWTTLVKNDSPAVVGAANRRYDCSSDRLPGAITSYESTRSEIVEAEIERLLRGANAQFVLFSYSNKGKIQPQKIANIMSALGRVTVNMFDHKENVQKALTINNLWPGDGSQNYEYLFLLEKS